MSLNHIGVLVPSYSAYDVLNAFAFDLHSAFCRIPGLKASLILPKDLIENYDTSLDALVLFNGYFSDPPICDRLRLPTLFWLVDNHYHFSKAVSEYGIFGCIDRYHSHWLRLDGYTRVVDLPHAVDSACHMISSAYRPYNCAMFSSPIDFRHYSMQWKSFPKPLKLALEETAERVLEDDNATLRESFIDALEYRLQMSFEEASTRLPIHALLQQLDLYIKSMGRLLILEQLQGIPIDVFGDANGWMALIGDRCPHVTVRGALPYKSVLERMTQTKVILSNCESVRDGAHERIFAALSSGAAVAVRGNPFLRNAFGSNKGVLLYGQQDGNLSDLVLKAIENDVWRSQSVESGQKEVAEHHLWDHRAAEILKVFTHWLPEMPRRDPSLQ